MRVPTRSAGTRSGVNWIRLKSPPIDCARVLIAIVLARPGTPSTSRCPRARSATTIRSSRWSCPTMTFLTSYNSRSIGSGPVCPSSSCSVNACPPRGSVRGQAGAPAGAVDRNGEADADEHVLLGRVDERGDDADDRAVVVQQRAARVAGVDGRVDLDQALDQLAGVAALERPVEARHDARAERP